VGATTMRSSGLDGGRLSKVANIFYIAPDRCTQQVEDVHILIEHMLSLIMKDLLECAANDER
jgi:hypothetical protein